MKEFVFGGEDTEEDYFGSGWNGLLVVQDLDRQTTSLEEQSESEIKILQASSWRMDLKKCLIEPI